MSEAGAPGALHQERGVLRAALDAVALLDVLVEHGFGFPDVVSVPNLGGVLRGASTWDAPSLIAGWAGYSRPRGESVDDKPDNRQDHDPDEPQNDERHKAVIGACMRGGQADLPHILGDSGADCLNLLADRLGADLGPHVRDPEPHQDVVDSHDDGERPGRLSPAWHALPLHIRLLTGRRWERAATAQLQCRPRVKVSDAAAQLAGLARTVGLDPGPPCPFHRASFANVSGSRTPPPTGSIPRGMDDAARRRPSSLGKYEGCEGRESSRS